MGYPKALLTLPSGKRFLENIIDNCGKITPPPLETLTVLGRHGTQIMEQINMKNIKVLNNSDPDRGQLSSLKIALENLREDVAGILLCLTDHPLVSPETYQAIIDTAEKNTGRIIIPSHNMRKGHPVFFPAEIFSALKSAPLKEGARFVINARNDITDYLIVEDPGILKDIDKPSDLPEGTKIPVIDRF